jgi:hypothetical protein
MKVFRLIASACTLGVVLSACGQTPTAMDAGHTFGSGNRDAVPAGGYTIGSGNAAPSTESTSTASPDSEVAAGDGAPTERGGYTYGSGN